MIFKMQSELYKKQWAHIGLKLTFHVKYFMDTELVCALNSTYKYLIVGK